MTDRRIVDVQKTIKQFRGITLTSNKSYRDWGATFGDPIIATAILHRLLHHSTTINIGGESYRLKDRRRAGLVTGSGFTRVTPSSASRT